MTTNDGELMVENGTTDYYLTMVNQWFLIYVGLINGIDIPMTIDIPLI